MEPTEVRVNINGEFRHGTDAHVSVLDRSFAYGDGVFEGIAVLEDTVLLLGEHVDRLFRSAERLAIDIGLSKETVTDQIVETVRENNMSAGYVRPLLSRGVGPYGIGAIDAVEGPDLYVIPRPGRSPSYDDPDPIAARFASLRQPAPDALDPRVKANNYLPNILAELEARGTDAETTILLNREGRVTEAAAANVYVVQDGRLRTPPTSDILVGTTRNALLEVAEAEGIETTTEPLTQYDLYTADECFLTNSLIGLRPVTRLHDRSVGEGEIGPLTRRLSEAFRTHLLATGTPV